MTDPTPDPLRDATATREHHDGCLEQGLYAKYRVRRIDGSDQPGGRHEGCWYFVLDPTHDPAARDALRRYAELVADERPRLAADLLARPELTHDPRKGGQA
jgi:hypothetical protein